MRQACYLRRIGRLKVYSCEFSFRGRKSILGQSLLDNVVQPRLLKNFDFTLLFAALAIIIYGCVMIYSASRGGRVGAGYVERQVIWAVLGLVGAAIIATIDHAIFHRYAGRLYFLTVIVLLVVLKGGHTAKGRATVDWGGELSNPALGVREDSHYHCAGGVSCQANRSNPQLQDLCPFVYLSGHSDAVHPSSSRTWAPVWF